MLVSLLDFFFPKQSLTGVEGSWLTEEEMQSLRASPVQFHKAELLRRNIRHIDLVIAANSYHTSPQLKRAILQFKYGRVRDIAPILGKLMVSAIADQRSPAIQKTDKPILCPVPLHWTRQFHRGFNQAAILAYEISQHTDLPIAHVLKRKKATGHQAWRTKSERFSAIRNAFAYCGPKLAPANVILIDDLFTTGSTLDACAKALKSAGVNSVRALVLAHG